MALIKCAACANEVSDNAASCPKCGHPIATAKPRSSRQATLAVLLGIGACWLWFGAHLYFIFPMDSAIFGGVLLAYGVIKFAMGGQRPSQNVIADSASPQSSTTIPALPNQSGSSPLKLLLIVGGICVALYLAWYFSPGGGYAQYKAQFNAEHGISGGNTSSAHLSATDESCEAKIKNFALKVKAAMECDYHQYGDSLDVESVLPVECKNTLGAQQIQMLYAEALGRTMADVSNMGHQAWCSSAISALAENSPKASEESKTITDSKPLQSPAEDCETQIKMFAIETSAGAECGYKVKGMADNTKISDAPLIPETCKKMPKFDEIFMSTMNGAIGQVKAQGHEAWCSKVWQLGVFENTNESTDRQEQGATATAASPPDPNAASTAPTPAPPLTSCYRTDAEDNKYECVRNDSGITMKSGSTVLYLGKSCDASSSTYGKGIWQIFPQQGFGLHFHSKNIWFPKQTPPTDYEACHETFAGAR